MFEEYCPKKIEEEIYVMFRKLYKGYLGNILSNPSI
jgi:hypothetical protein